MLNLSYIVAAPQISLCNIQTTIFQNQVITAQELDFTSSQSISCGQFFQNRGILVSSQPVCPFPGGNFLQGPLIIQGNGFQDIPISHPIYTLPEGNFPQGQLMIAGNSFQGFPTSQEYAPRIEDQRISAFEPKLEITEINTDTISTNQEGKNTEVVKVEKIDVGLQEISVYSSHSDTFPHIYQTEISTSSDNLFSTIEKEEVPANLLSNLKSSLFGILQKGRLSCSDCSETFQSQKDLQVHNFKAHVGNKSQICNICGVEFSDISIFNAHQFLRGNAKPFQCNDCSKWFPSICTFAQHTNLHHNQMVTINTTGEIQQQSNFQQPKEIVVSSNVPCKKKTTSVLKLKVRRAYKQKSNPQNLYETRLRSASGKKDVMLDMTNPDKPYKCPACNQNFCYEDSLTLHLEQYCRITNKRESCSVCGKTFAYVNQLQAHLRIHTREKPFACLVCNKRFRQKGDMKYHHSIVHLDAKHFLCEVCGKSFVSSSLLKRHMLAHTQEKPHSCSLCGKKFAYSHRLKQHYMRHTNEKPYDCKMCDKSFLCMSYLKDHIRVHTRERPFSCKICGKGFSQLGSVKLHQRVHIKQLSS